MTGGCHCLFLIGESIILRDRKYDVHILAMWKKNNC